MEQPDAKRLSEAIEAGLRDGRTLESLRKAMLESGYSEDSIKAVISNVDRQKILRRPKRKKTLDYRWVAAAVLAVMFIGMFSSMQLGLLGGTQGKPIGGIVGGQINTSPGTDSPIQNGTRVCYVVNESIKDAMIKAGAQCDEWYLISIEEI